MNWTIEFSPLLPPLFFWIAIGLTIFGSVLLLIRRGRGFIVRFLALILLMLAVANPSLRQEERDALSNIAVVLVDESASQKIGGRIERTKRVKEQLAGQLSNISNLEIRWITSAKRPNDSKEGTTLFADLNRGLEGIPADRLSGIILITDGQVHDVPTDVSQLGLNVPVHGLITGGKGEQDRRIEVLKAPRFGIVGSTAQIKLKVVESGKRSVGDKPATLTVTREKKQETYQVSIGEEVEIPIDFPHAGKNIVEIELSPGENELTLANNRLAISAEGVRENLRVLLVSGEPHAGERTWRNLLKSDAAVDLVHFTILRPPEKHDGTPINQLSLIAFPTRELFSEKLEEFDLIIFDRYQQRGVLPLLYLDNVARYVRKGGAVLVAAGKSFSDSSSLYRTPLSQILPASPTGRLIEQPFKAQITEAGNKHPVTRNLPSAGTDGRPQWGRWFRVIEAEAKDGRILMKGPEEKPLLILRRYGEGRVALLLSDHAWLWARGFEGGGPYTALLRRLSHWLMKEPDLEEEFLRAKGTGDQIVLERRSMSDEISPVTVVGPDGEVSEVILEKNQPGLWNKTVDTKLPGLYRLKSGELSAIAHVGPLNSKEFSDVAATVDILDPSLKPSGGGTFWTARSDDPDDVTLPRISMLRSARIMHGSNWLGLRERDAYQVKGVRLIPLIAGFLALLALLGVITFTWFREGR